VNEHVNIFQTLSELYLKQTKFHYDISIFYQKETIGKTTFDKSFYTNVYRLFPTINYIG